MDIILFSVLLLFAISLLVLGFIRKHIVLIIFSGIAFMIVGIFAINGIEYVSSTTIFTNNISTTTIVNNYSNWTHSFGNSNIYYNQAIGWLFSLFGLFIVIVAAVLSFGKDKVGLSLDDGGSNDGEE